MKYLSRMSLRQKMMILFAVPLILLEIVVFFAVTQASLGQYRTQLNRSVDQSRRQTVSFLENKVTSMEYMAQLVANDSMIQSTLSGEEYGQPRSFIDEYNEFYLMNRAFDRMELSNGSYRMILYVPDSVFYKENEYYFYSITRLQDRGDYPQILAGLEKEGEYYSISYEKTEKTNAVNTTRLDMLTRFHPIKANGGYGRQMGICSVSIPLEELLQIMKDSNVTETGSVFMLNAKDEIVVSSNEELARQLRSSGKIKNLDYHDEFTAIESKGETYYISVANFGIEDWKLVTAIPRAEMVSGLYEMIIEFGVGLMLMLVLIYFISRLLAGYYTNRLSKLSTNMKELEKGDLYVQLPKEEVTDEMDEVYLNFNFMVNEVRRMVQEHYQLGKEVKNSELKALQAQINPHFLYNTLDLINWMAIDYDAEDIRDITFNLARFYRLSLNRGKSLISMGEEVEHVQVYVAIENFHYEGAIVLQTEIEEEIKNLACLNIIMQPFVENSIVHGIAEHPEIAETLIQITAKREGDMIRIVIEDDGPGMSDEMMKRIVSVDETSVIKQKGYGIRNVNFRVKLCFGDQYGVSYERPEEGGTRAIISIPALSMEEAEKLIF